MDHLRTGVVLGQRYRLVAPVRAARPRGAWRAIDVVADREVAVKAIAAQPPGPLTSPARLAVLLRTATELSYPGIAQVHDCGHLAVPGQGIAPFLVRELVRGPTLEDRLADGSLRVGEALGIVASVADALAAAHRAGMVHGNLVPANIVLSPSGAKITDFALWLVRDRASGGESASVLSYTAPELAAGGPATPATDMYSLGVVFVACMTGIAAGGTVGALPVAGLTSERAASDLTSLWAACLGASPPGRPSAAHVAVISRQMAAAGPWPLAASAAAGPAAAQMPGQGSGPREPGDSPQPGAPPRRRGGRRGRLRGRLGLSRPAARTGSAARSVPGRAGTASPAESSRAAAQAGRRWGGLAALGGAATGMAVAVLIVLSRFVSPPAGEAVGQHTSPAARARPGVTAIHSPHTSGTASSPDARSSSPEITPAAPPPAPPPSPRQAVDDIWRTIHDGVSAGQIRPDAGLDFDNLIQPVRAQLAAGKAVPVAALVATLRDKLAARVSEGAVAGSVARVLSAEFTELLHSAGG